ncbi:transposase [Luteolibacter ambystomatis]|uniref:Transposase n=1 Tax=Luteolibacter ambystomatis TaxID=2824561 RepID=A0A975G6Q4_9BACT|nr:transposase [Luteolibacter ambystomatis]
MLDNAGWHKSARLNWHHIEPVCLPPYSPDFNPIERLWQHLKGQYFAGFLTGALRQDLQQCPDPAWTARGHPLRLPDTFAITAIIFGSRSKKRSEK